MLSLLERQEILQDAEDEKRRESFRQILVKKTPVSFDDYLRFLTSVQNIFLQTALPVQRPFPQGFKL
jgi:biotin synthase-related radical SAM superfamily protein